jgi:sporulation protein YlmC with PRC-barrel domain
MHLVKSVLDKGLVDANGNKVGKVDDLVLELRDGQPPAVRSILSGRGALAAHLWGPLRTTASWLRKNVLGVDGDAPPSEIGWEHVTQIDVVVHLDLDRENSDLMSTENAIWKRWIAPLPWAER